MVQQNARVAALTDELVQTIIGFNADTNRRAYRHARDIAARGLRAHQYNRTNQFEVDASYHGLDEKFRVLDRDHLADALKSRVQELRHVQGRSSRWVPEYLALLLQLSDRPTENAGVEALELLRPPAPEESLTWKQILEDDPYSDEDIWKDVDYAEESSGDEWTPRKRDKGPDASSASSIEGDDTFNPETCVEAVNGSALSALEEAQFWKASGDADTAKTTITELQAVRETLFMLSGVQTSLYHTDCQQGTIHVDQKYNLSHAISQTVDHLLSQFADIGRQILHLRQWTTRHSPLPLVQTFEAAVQSRLAQFDRYLASLQHMYLAPDQPVAVSLLELHLKVENFSRPLVRLAQIIIDIEPQLLVNPFAHLETLFDQVSLAQMTLEEDLFTFFSKLFFECLATYLKPIRKWMESGELGTNDETFFVFEDDSSTDISSLWHDRFVLRRGAQGTLRSPRFLQPAAMKIFNTGKSVVFLKELGLYRSGLGAIDQEPRLDHQAICGYSGTPLSPFSDLFQAAFEGWIRSKYSLASAILRSHLFDRCGLLRVLNNFNVFFLGADGSLFRDFADAVFERMDTQQRGWNDRFLLTELARGIYGAAMARSDAEKIVVRSIRVKDQMRSVKRLSSISLDYAIPWPIMNIVQRSSIPTYQQIFTSLLQTYRTKYLLQATQLSTIRALKNPRTRQLSYKLRARIIWFADILRSYLTEIVAACTETMTAEIIQAKDIDEMSAVCLKYLAKMQEQTLLADNLKPIHGAIISLLDLGVVYHDAHVQSPCTDSKAPTKSSSSRSQSTITKPPAKPSKRKPSRRKSMIPLLTEDSSDPETEAELENPKAPQNNVEESPSSTATLESTLQKVDAEFERLLPFVVAGLRNIGRVGAQVVWEVLAERLDWERGRGGLGAGMI